MSSPSWIFKFLVSVLNLDVRDDLRDGNKATKIQDNENVDVLRSPAPDWTQNKLDTEIDRPDFCVNKPQIHSYEYLITAVD